jgi:hypothetical protein
LRSSRLNFATFGYASQDGSISFFLAVLETMVVENGE